MALHDFTSQRLYLDLGLSAGELLPCAPEQANYLVNVLRMRPGDRLLVFNGVDGEWVAEIADAAKRRVTLRIVEQSRAQSAGPDVDYLFAPLKHARLDYMVQKATEMGVRRLSPVLTRRTMAERVNLERMRANVIEAAEQCGVLRVPIVDEPRKLVEAVAQLDTQRRLVFCDEDAPLADPVAALGPLAGGPVAVLIGPEGGFAPEERAALLARPRTVAISLGPRIMRADTAAVAALALVNATIGDWR